MAAPPTPNYGDLSKFSEEELIDEVCSDPRAVVADGVITDERWAWGF